jgi:hypothetical protein
MDLLLILHHQNRLLLLLQGLGMFLIHRHHQRSIFLVQDLVFRNLVLEVHFQISL